MLEDFKTKPDNVVALAFPGGANLLFVIGNTVIEQWYNIGAALFPYQKQQYNIDYGTVSPASVDWNEDMVVWLAQNEKSDVVLMYSQGGKINQISTDGINFLLARLTAPQDSYGFLYKQDGHLLYQFAFYTDNLSYVYDFNTDQFFTVSDEHMNYHIAQKMVLFNHKNYFISNIDGNLYEFGSQFTDYNGAEIPRIRVCQNVRLKNNNPFVVNKLAFTMEQGTDSVYYAALPQIQLSISNDGGMSFSSYQTQELNPIGKQQNRVVFYQLGYCNDFVAQFRFVGMGRFVVTDGVVTIY